MRFCHYALITLEGISVLNCSVALEADRCLSRHPLGEAQKTPDRRDLRDAEQSLSLEDAIYLSMHLLSSAKGSSKHSKNEQSNQRQIRETVYLI